ncbi:hypothetical protein Ahy_B08g089361 [Arachis hypogaea]|uniref:Ubiquitin-like protease family profile domain-containing protein n=1 Tax=Arachis hypogaea TaxID=3818 RepID=A0A444XXH5_ARAHY|nr:hypothetical protein Ahy_B08g089361 [Arachis hypogaea]
MADSSTSSTSQSYSEKKQMFHFRASFDTEDIQLVAKIRKFHQHNIELSIKNLQRKQSYNTQGDLFSQKVDYKKLSEDDKEIFRRFQGKTLKSLTDEMMDIGVGNEEDRLMFKRIFILYIQMAFLLRTTINKISPVHLAPIFEMDTITERNWGGHVLSFIVKGITDYKEKKKKAIDSCLFALMIIYFHLSKNKGKKRAERPPKPWIANWSKEQLDERMMAEREENMYVLNNDCLPSRMDSKKKKKSQEDSDSESESTFETQSKKQKAVVEHSSPEEDQSYDSDRYEIGSEDLDELLRKNNEKSAAEGEKEADLRSTEGRYVSSETIPDVNLGSDDPSSQGHTEQSSVNRPAESMLSLVQESASEPADSNIMVVREETPSEGLAIVPIQVFVPVSQTTTVPEFEETPETDFEPTPLLQIEGTTKTTPEPPPQQIEESTPTPPPAPSKIYPAAEDAAALMMMARTTSYVPKTDPMPSFSLGLTDSSQEEAATQEGASTQEADRAKTPETANLLEQLENLVQKIASSAAKEESKSPQIQKETGGESSGKFETPAGINQNTGDMKEKCYIWATRVKTYADGKTNEFDNVCTLIAQDKYILSRMHLASLEAGSYIEAEIVSAMCLILNQKNDKRFREQVYCLPPDIVNMAISKHPNGEFISPKTNKEFRVEDYPMFIPFIDAKKINFASIYRCISIQYKGYVISRIRAYAGGAPLKKKENELEIKAIYVNISGQKSSYDCAIYVMKWLELIEPENIKRAKYEWDNWPQDEVDHYRVEYASRILFSEMNKERDQTIRASNAIRLSKPSSVLLSPFCQINSTDMETE